ncbi:hypothetical protein FISHEDRAFT_76193 [Fistulina hepatica ATCC 64428]|uniref:Uncharacterized protein n=1 Tax=Fistulina hepatica ATCC 64428 TaxID=1128425 RepID=A0A0D7A6F5_9AGAR|nr:hypothetical protein FISHEDRAFT_76193 [Fistulina hepatica ATCC 64428]
MKSLRKSLTHKDSLRNQISTPVPLPNVSKPSSAIIPPQKVIRAVTTYRSQAPQELSFKKGDFFHVVAEIEQQGVNWYEAHNPITGARGLVHRDMFEEFMKSSHRTSMPVQKKNAVFYAIVMHDFQAERPDELEAKRGDPITVVAQSNREWFVAKPIGRLGRPGLIPVSFVEVHDPATGRPVPDVDALLDRGDLPKVEEWKREVFNYKQSSITLGVIDSPNTRGSVPNSPYAPQHPPSQPLQQQSPPQQPDPEPELVQRPPTPDCLPEGILLSADCVSFHYEMEQYWFRVDAIFQPYPEPNAPLPPARQLILFRVYEDFYDLQITLLNAFPKEAGRDVPKARILPFMPGPSEDVDDKLTATRRGELDVYLHQLCDLSRSGARYILEDRITREFLASKPGDVVTAVEPRAQELEELSMPYEDEYGEVQDQLGHLRVGDDDGGDYDDEHYQPNKYGISHPYANAQGSSDNIRLAAHVQNHERTSTGSIGGAYVSGSRSNSPGPDASRKQSDRLDSYTQAASSTTSLRSQSASASASADARSRSHSTVTAPPISANNPQAAYIKIKIHDRPSNEVVAIRVHPNITLPDLVDKIQARLGGPVTMLKYRDSSVDWEKYINIRDEDDFRLWLQNANKYTLFTDSGDTNS